MSEEEEVLNREEADAFRLCDLGANGEEANVLTCVTSGFAKETERRAAGREVGENMLYLGDC